MAKKKSWGINLDTTKSAAEEAIQKTSHTKPRKPAKPKKKVGRPKQIEKPTTQIKIYVEARDLLRKLAAMEGIIMTDYVSELIHADAKKKGIK